jgi:hypothetical protein
MDRVRDHICFAVWFVGLSYVALWPMAVPDSVASWLAPEAGTPRGCGGLAIASLQELCSAHEAVALSPGMHLVGMLAAFWVTVRLMTLLLSIPLRWLPLARLQAALRLPLTLLMRHRSRRLPPPRYVPRRREFGLRGGPR